MAAPDLEQAVPGVEGKRPAREVAQRVFAAEYNASNLEHREPGDRSPSFVVTPLGARVNRVFLVGVLTSNETVGETGEMWRAQITDPTGVFQVFAGQYQPEAARALSELKPPCVVAVVGKSRVYSPEPGVLYTSIRPESIRVVDVADRDQWVAETARFTLERLDAMREATALAEPSKQQMVDLGYREDLADGAVRALAHYGPPEVAKWAATIRDALEFLTPDGEERRRKVDEGFVVASEVAGAAGPAAAPQAPPPEDDAKSEIEERVFGIVERLDDGKGAHWKDVVAEAAKLNVAEDQVEEALNGLMDKGLVYEPVLGRLKKAD